jgi:hypothetical protein
MNLTKPRLDQFKITGSTVGDLYFPQTKLLLPFDGANGATTTSDLSNSNHTVTFVGNAEISTAQSKFGGSSLSLDGSSYLSIPTSSSWTVGSSDYSADMWIKTTDGVADLVSAFKQAAPNNGWLFGIGFHTVTDGKLAFYNASSSYELFGGTAFVNDGEWHHVAFTKSGATLRLFVDGVLDATGTITITSTNSGEAILIGRDNNASPSRHYSGYLDELRISQGIARWTAAFTPPTSAPLTSAGDVNKQIIINSTADGVAIGTGGINQARIAKAWVNFNGSGTVAIRDSYNVGSITDNGTGTYTVNFSTAMTNANYCCNMNSGDKAVVWGIPLFDGPSTFLAGSCKIVMQNPSDQPQDNPIVCASFFGN